MDVRYQKPIQEVAPYGTLCKVISGYGTEKKEEEFYIQVSKDKEKPEWLPFEKVLLGAFQHKFKDNRFIKKCLNLLEINKGNTASS